MTETYLNGKLTVTSLAVPTAEDIRKIEALTDEERTQFENEAIQRGIDSPVTDATLEDVWEEAKRRVAARAAQPSRAL